MNLNLGIVTLTASATLAFGMTMSSGENSTQLDATALAQFALGACKANHPGIYAQAAATPCV